MVRIEEPYGGRPALQQFIKGQAYSVGGLFHNGRPLRLCAHRKLLTYPRGGGVTVKGVTERPGDLLEETAKAFGALQYTGLGHAEFIRDEHEGGFKFIEINPRVWGSIGIAEHAGVDLYRPYHELVVGAPVGQDLNYKEGVVYHRFSAEVQLIAESPARLPGFLKDAIDPRVTSDFCWSDLGPYLAAIRRRRSNGDGSASSIPSAGLDPAIRE
jgi:predicted ATP-grasp superfamily ATP-dependent carboligase